jgi:hypothetical protein
MRPRGCLLARSIAGVRQIAVRNGHALYLLRLSRGTDKQVRDLLLVCAGVIMFGWLDVLVGYLYTL